MATAKRHISKKGKITYYLRAYDGYDINGKQIEHTTTWCPPSNMSEKAILKELEKQKIMFEEKIKTGLVFGASTRFSEYAERWLENNKPPQLAPKTYERYKALLTNINAAIGNIKLENLQSHHLQSFYNNLRENGMNSRGNYAIPLQLNAFIKEKGLSKIDFAAKADISSTTLSAACKENGRVSINTAEKISKALNINMEKIFKIEHSSKGFSDKTILHHHRLISSILAQATRDRLVPFNAADKDYIKAPRVARKEAAYLDDESTEKVMELLQQEPIKWRVAIMLLIYSGMRRGELMGLEWKDIDFENKLIHVRRTSQYVSSLGIITKETKNLSSERTIRLPDEAFTLLSIYKKHLLEYRLMLGNLWQDKITITYVDGSTDIVPNDRLFIKDDSTPMNPDSLTDWTKKFVTKNNLPKFSPHSLRHTNASLLIANGVNLSTVAKRLGHSNVATTTKVYTHAIQSADEAAADVLSEKLNPIKNNLNKNLI